MPLPRLPRRSRADQRYAAALSHLPTFPRWAFRRTVLPALRISFRRALRRSSPAVLRVRRLERGIEPDLFSLRPVNNVSTQQLEPGTAIHGLFSIFRRFICSSNGLVIHGRSSAAWMAPMSRRRPAANSHVAAVWLSIALCTWCRPN